MGGGLVKEKASYLTDIFTLDKQLGSGGNAYVFRVYYKGDEKKTRPFALKIGMLGLDEDQIRQTDTSLIREYCLMKYIGMRDECNNIVCPRAFIRLRYTFPREFYDSDEEVSRRKYYFENDPEGLRSFESRLSEEATYPCMLMDYVDGQTVMEVLDELAENKDMSNSYEGNDSFYKDGDLYLNNVLDVFEEDVDLLERLINDAIEACKVLKKYHILHRDLQDHNVMIDRQGHLKLIDFGNGCNFEIDKECTSEHTNGYDLAEYSLKPLIGKSQLFGDERKRLFEKLKVLYTL